MIPRGLGWVNQLDRSDHTWTTIDPSPDVWSIQFGTLASGENNSASSRLFVVVVPSVARRAPVRQRRRVSRGCLSPIGGQVRFHASARGSNLNGSHLRPVNAYHASVRLSRATPGFSLLNPTRDVRGRRESGHSSTTASGSGGVRSSWPARTVGRGRPGAAGSDRFRSRRPSGS
jgi:hypothetical protein